MPLDPPLRDLTRLFEELASPVRMTLLHALSEGRGTVTTLSAAVGLSPQEVSRHLGRLAELDLVHRAPSRAYLVSPLGAAILEELPSFAALWARRTFFQEHQLDALPPGLPMRPVALAEHLGGSESENMQRASGVVHGARRRVVYLGNEVGWVAQALFDRAKAGVEVELLLPWALAGSDSLLGLGDALGDEAAGRVWVRLVEQAPLLLGHTESEAFAFFLAPDGRPDFSHLVHGQVGLRGWGEGLLDRLRPGSAVAFDPARHRRQDWEQSITQAASGFLGAERRRAARP